jgi:uncharacterized protein (UPF0262 family)
MTINQNNFKDTQNFEIDIDKIFTDFISQIDSVRSNINISSKDNESKLKKITEQSLSGLSNVLKMEIVPQESRCHAFYRLIGFPVVNKDKNQFYNPGFDNTENKKSKAEKITIANNLVEGFNKLSIYRESYLNKIKDIFSLNRSIDAGVLALTSSTQIRKFSSPMEKTNDPFDTKIENSKYVLETFGIVGGGNSILLSDYVDANNKKTNFFYKDGSNLQFNNKNHVIKPFLVDPRIDFTVNPSKNLVAVPFVKNKSQLKISQMDYVKRPLLEKIIRERSSNDVNIGSSTQEIVDFIKSIDVIKDENLIQKVTQKDGTYKLSEQLQFSKYLNIIRAMIIKLVEAQVNIEKIQSSYYWIPIPNKNGPEFGNDSQPIFLSVPDDFRTEKDREIIQLKVTSVINQLNSQAISIDGAPDVGDFAFESVKTTFSDDTSNAYGDLAERNLNELINHRANDLKIAESSLRTIEIIMGEFSGLGLCDIIAIMGALYILPIEDLLGFLDDFAFERMQETLNLNSSRSDLVSSYTNFTNIVKDFYTIMDKIYEDIRQNNGMN